MNRMNLVIEGAYQPYPGIMFPLENTLHDDSTDHLLIILIKCLFLLTLVSHFTIYCLQHFVQTKVIITAHCQCPLVLVSKLYIHFFCSPRCGRWSGSGRGPNSGRHGLWHPVQTWHLWWSNQVKQCKVVFMGNNFPS